MKMSKLQQISAALGVIVVAGAALSTVDQYRWWASAGEIHQVAGVSYSTAIAWEQEELDDTQFQLDKCAINQNCTDAQIRRLNRRKHDLEEKIDMLKKDREQYTSKGKGP